MKLGTISRIAVAVMMGHAMATAAPLRVMLWNIHHGEGTDGKIDLQRIADVIGKESPDVVMLQEVDRNMPRSGKVDQASELARLLRMNSVFGKAVGFGEGEYGLAVLSRGRIVSGKVHPLPGEAGEPRIGFEVVLEHAGESITVVNTHLDHQSDERRLAQAQAVAQLALDSPKAVLAGDFNDVPVSPVMNAVTALWIPVEKTEPKATSPSHRPKHEIDHILFRGLRVVEKAVVLKEARASDHRAVVALLDTSDEPPPAGEGDAPEPAEAETTE
ncbi:MAG: endonuclease/exonuclease/phosphatase family protein [Akkermansiaceae bacterium]|jgi:endonuclease/exonuclease/phosphatase family metal-dependent hydrolase|nr:endonuclease/exonuclease/phosphatase family protein [Akkermansiaceae bacterium]